MSNDHNIEPPPSSLIELPIACTLEPGEGAVRAARWRALHAQAPPTSTRKADRLLLRYPSEPDVLKQLEDLVAAERDCCAFADWQLVAHERCLELQIRADPDSLDALPATIQTS